MYFNLFQNARVIKPKNWLVVNLKVDSASKRD